MKKLLGYAAYGFCMAAVFLVTLFPSETAGRYAENQFARRAPGFRLSLGGLTPYPPFTFKLEKPVLSDSRSAIARAESVVLKPSLFSVLAKKPDVDVTIKAYGGSMEGSVKAADDAQGLAGPYGGHVSFRGIRVQDVDLAARASEGRVISGELSGDLDFEGLTPDGGGLKGEGDLTLSAGKLVMWTGLMAGMEIPFDAIHMMVSFKNQTLTVEECVLDGDLAKGSFSGTITLRRPMESSMLRLKGKLEPSPAFFESSGVGEIANQLFGKRGGTDSIPFTVSGSLADANFAIR